MDDNLPSKENLQKSSNKRFCCFTIPKRYILCFLIFTGFLIMNCERSCLSVAIVAMVTGRKIKSEGHFIRKEAEFHWNSKMKGIILSAFFYGYIVLQIPGGWLALKIGAKRIMGAAILTASLVSIFLPLIVRYSVSLFIAARVLQGLALGVTIPTNHVVWSKWSPPQERSSLISFSVAGLSAGMLVAMPISGFLAEYGFEDGWPSVFHTFGIAGVVWVFLWQVLVYETPDVHPTISEEEKKAIQVHSTDDKESIDVPWCLIVRSKAVWAIMSAHFCFDCSYYTLLICMPLFLRDVHRFNIATTGMLAALPWLFMSLMTFGGGFLSDMLRKRLQTVTVRKLLYTSGMLGSAIFVVISGYGNQASVTVVFMSIAVAFFGLSFTGFMVNPLDIAPKFAGIIIGLSNCVSTMPGFLGPSLVGILTKDEGRAGWQTVFYIMSGISMLGIVVFNLFASGNVQSWASPLSDTDISEGEPLLDPSKIERGKEETETNDKDNLISNDKEIDNLVSSKDKRLNT